MKRVKDTHPKAVTMDDMTAWLNLKAVISNEGKWGGKYADFTDFNKFELMSHLSLYLLHSILPYPRLDMKFKVEAEDPVNGLTLFNEVFGKSGVTRHKEFKAFFRATNPIIPTPSTNTHPNWKVETCLKHFARLSKECKYIGRNIACDKQDIATHHPDSE